MEQMQNLAKFVKDSTSASGQEVIKNDLDGLHNSFLFTFKGRKHCFT